MKDLELLVLADIKQAADGLSLEEIRYLVTTYYLIQEQRKRHGNQVRDLAKADKPCDFIAWTYEQFHRLELVVAKVLDYWTRNKPLGMWCRSIIGIGPVITAGLMAHINLEPWVCKKYQEGTVKMPCTPKAPCGPRCGHEVLHTVGHIWRFAGLDPTTEWGKGQRRPWNAELKTLCWKIGESFVKVSNNPASLYGRLYKERKEYETERNEALAYRDQAVEKLRRHKIGKNTEAYRWYSQGKLPPAHIHARAKRYAVKIFLAHYHEKAYELQYGKKPPLPYPIAILGHAHHIPLEAAK